MAHLRIPLKRYYHIPGADCKPEKQKKVAKKAAKKTVKDRTGQDQYEKTKNRNNAEKN